MSTAREQPTHKRGRKMKAMNTYSIYLNNEIIANVSDTEAAYACYEAAKTIAKITDKTASLVWDETAEVVAYFGDDLDYEWL
jgi:hypothetical protein